MAVRWSLLTFVILSMLFSSYPCTSESVFFVFHIFQLFLTAFFSKEGCKRQLEYIRKTKAEEGFERQLKYMENKEKGFLRDVSGDTGKTASTKVTKDEFVEIITRTRRARTPAVWPYTYTLSQGMTGDVRGFKDDIEPVGEENISQALDLLRVGAVGGEWQCLRVDTSDQCCRTITFWDVVVDGRSMEDFLLMSEALASHNMSQYMWVSFNETHVTPPARRFKCVPRNVTQQRVRIVTSAELVQMLGPKNESRGFCAVVMFYAPWCVFCARVAPHYNALARAFPQLDVLAIDAMHFSNLNSRFGTVAVPSILLFHNSKAVSRFNGTLRILDNLVSFVTNVTGLQPNISVGVLPDDYNGPLASNPTASPDYLLWLAWSFTVTFFAVVLVRSTIVTHLVKSVLSFGQEHQAIH